MSSGRTVPMWGVGLRRGVEGGGASPGGGEGAGGARVVRSGAERGEGRGAPRSLNKADTTFS